MDLLRGLLMGHVWVISGEGFVVGLVMGLLMGQVRVTPGEGLG